MAGVLGRQGVRVTRSGRAIMRIPQPVPPAYTVHDTFTRADSTTTLGTTDTGQAWTAHTGTWGIVSNQGYLVTQSGDSVATVNSTKSDIDMTCTIKHVTETSLVFRAIDNNNYLLVLVNNSNIELWRRVAGAYTQIATTATAHISGGVYVVRIVASGTSITVYEDGVSKIATTSSQFQTETRVGLRCNTTGSSSRTWESLIVL